MSNQVSPAVPRRLGFQALTACIFISLLAWHFFSIDIQSFFVDEVEELKFAKGPFLDAVF